MFMAFKTNPWYNSNFRSFTSESTDYERTVALYNKPGYDFG